MKLVTSQARNLLPSPRRSLSRLKFTGTSYARHVVGIMKLRVAYKPGATGDEDKSNQSPRGHVRSDK
jgi:hypothetical protein